MEFSFDETAIKILQKNEKFALELDVVDNDEILDAKNWSYYGKSNNFPSGVEFGKDTGMGDKADQLSLLIFRPNLLKKDTK